MTLLGRDNCHFFNLNKYSCEDGTFIYIYSYIYGYLGFIELQNFAHFTTSFPKSRHRYFVQTGLCSRKVCTPSPATAYTALQWFVYLQDLRNG
jgi:hypothetical protein